MKGMKAMLWLWFAFILTIFVIGCKPTVPSTFLSESEMEAVLYDYHLADALASQKTDSFNYYLVAYREAVFKKYGITQAEFDTSMVYYMRHTDKLQTIYKHIGDRLQADMKRSGVQNGNFAAIGDANADTVNIWGGAQAMALIPLKPYNVYSFAYHADSSFHKRDTYILSATGNFIYQNGLRDGVLSLAVVFGNDSVSSNVMHLTMPGRQDLRIEDVKGLGIKEVKGFFLLKQDSQTAASNTGLQVMVLSDIQLLRCRAPKKEVKPEQQAPSPDSTAVQDVNEEQTRLDEK